MRLLGERMRIITFKFISLERAVPSISCKFRQIEPHANLGGLNDGHSSGAQDGERPTRSTASAGPKRVGRANRARERLVCSKEIAS